MAPPSPELSSEDAEPRPLEVELRSGERFRGLLAFSNEALVVLEVEGHLLELQRREVVGERFLEADPSWSPPAESALRITREPRGGRSLSELARAACGKRALALFLPSRAPEAWAARPDTAPAAGPFPLWEPEEALPLECVPHLVGLASESGPEEWVEGLLAELEPAEPVLLESAAAPLALARFLGQLRWAYVGGRALGLRFYDPRVLRDLWAHLDDASLGLLFGGAWTREESGVEELRCVLCDGLLAALARRCASCGAELLGAEEAPALIGAQACLEGDELLVAHLEVGVKERGRFARAPQRGRKAFWLEGPVVTAIGAAYRERVAELDGPPAGAKT